MTRLLASVAMIAMVTPALTQETPAVKAAKALNGSYTVKELNFDGQTPEDILKAITGVEIKDGTITIQSAKKDDPATFVLNPAQQPATIDLSPKTGGDKPKLGLYKFEKGELTIVFSDSGTRPNDFGTGEGVRKIVLVKKK